jgi:hypothetical protein
MYGRTALLSGIISKARERVRAFYGLSGSHQQVRENVEWLLAESKFLYGEVDLSVRGAGPSDLLADHESLGTHL